MKILGVGLGRTGTKSLTQALRTLGFTTLHNDRTRLNEVIDGRDPAPDFRIYDDVDAVTDLPSAYFFRELLEAYPDARAILTERDTDSWARSYAQHIQRNDDERRGAVKSQVGRVLGLDLPDVPFPHKGRGRTS